MLLDKSTAIYKKEKEIKILNLLINALNLIFLSEKLTAKLTVNTLQERMPYRSLFVKLK